MAIGLFVVRYAGQHYTVGEMARMGPGFFPVVLGWVLTGLGGLMALLSMRGAVQGVQPPPWRPRVLMAVLAAVVVFALLVERLGLVPATLALTLVASVAQRPYRWRRAIGLGLVLALLAWLIFSVGLKMTLPAFAFTLPLGS
ncbi:MAG: tripartite tricarboxylate transporter TctB family protein [Rhodoferax sp.]